MKQFEKGDRVVWEYIHSLNSRSKVKRFKKGTFVRIVKPRPIVGANTPSRHYGIVLFDGNKTESKVSLAELRYEQMTKRIYRG